MKQLYWYFEGLPFRRAAGFRSLDTVVVGESGWAGQDGTGRGRTRRDFIRDRSWKTLLWAPVFVSGGKDPGLLI